MIDGSREEFRPAERVILPLAALLKPILPRSLRINHPESFSRVMIDAMQSSVAGDHLLTSQDLV